MQTRFFTFLLILSVDVTLSQKDCTGITCPVLQNCIESVLNDGACCPKCTQRGCTCEGYQYYDCKQQGFKDGKVPEGESYFVDFGSTECSCPQGGGNISCLYILCPEISPNCIDISQPGDGQAADRCPQCRRIGCAHGSKTYEAGHSFQLDQCQVCHCPNEGGRLTCSPIPGCLLHGINKPTWATTTENNSHLRDIRGGHDTRSTSLFSKIGLASSLPLFKKGPPSFGSEHYDYELAEPTSSTIRNLAKSQDAATVSSTYPESSSAIFMSHDVRGNDLAEKPRSPVSSSEKDLMRVLDSTTTGAQSNSFPLTTSTATQVVSTDNQRSKQGTEERPMRHNTHRNKGVRHFGEQKPSRRGHTRHHGETYSVSHTEEAKASLEQKSQLGKQEHGFYPTVQFSPTSRAPVRMREEPQRQSHTLDYHSQDVEEEDTEVSVKELVKACCETGEKWASANGHCSNMKPPTDDRRTICWTAQQQCCLGSLKERQCLAGIEAARAGSFCREDASSECGTDSYKECCSCCFLGLQLHRAGHRCEAHQYPGLHCQHVSLNCCKQAEGTQTIRDRPAMDPTLLPVKVSDSLYPKEAFSIGEERDGENAVEGPIKDMDECLIYEGNICHQRCINTPGSFRCECYPGYVLQEDAFTCAQERTDEENRLKEFHQAAVETTSPLPPPTQPSVPLNPCEGNSICEQQCIPVGGRPQCSCSLGFSLRADGRSCDDVDECLSAHGCQLNERCVNTRGSYVCQRLITCLPGYQISNDVCEDIDECMMGNHNCGDGLVCLNTAGSFRCNPKPVCPAGFKQDAQGNCIDIDECTTLTQPCSSGFICTNTAGSYICKRKIICSRGYHASPDGSRCVDVNECESGLHRCAEGQLCHNMAGSYRCECRTGYQYDSFRRMCVDINECWRYPGRLCAQTCENTPGSYECSCTSGFRLSADGKSCEDVNECLTSQCSQKCANIYGSYQCYCRKGFYLREDRHTCEDIDECSQRIGHLCTYRCVNTPGNYQCVCPEYGYSMSPNGRSCRDIDECATGTHNCSLGEKCYNIQGGYRCLSLNCPVNYRKVTDTRCERISCPNYLQCQNSPQRITYYYLSFQSNIVIPAQIFRIGPAPAYSGDNVIVTITEGNEENYFSTRKLNAYTGAVFLQRQVQSPRDFLITVEMKLWRQGKFATFQARLYVFITPNLL
ncbi:fibulin-2-like isoform X1 [Poeciliopsis prolifica]|uniref:fibulin-2-like isoform X1 n=1 Tax=Poeciliopsis prolifica TaxID=188132 RepID=UPI0024137B2D|nr:fibulin-2-like isoform X1 [Poeciliopsis prolifica]